MKAFQLLNDYGLPAGDTDFNDLAIFATRKDAQNRIKYLMNECLVDNGGLFSIVEVELKGAKA